jgi:hypothetical protein
VSFISSHSALSFSVTRAASGVRSAMQCSLRRWRIDTSFTVDREMAGNSHTAKPNRLHCQVALRHMQASSQYISIPVYGASAPRRSSCDQPSSRGVKLAGSDVSRGKARELRKFRRGTAGVPRFPIQSIPLRSQAPSCSPVTGANAVTPLSPLSRQTVSLGGLSCSQIAPSRDSLAWTRTCTKQDVTVRDTCGAR